MRPKIKTKDKDTRKDRLRTDVKDSVQAKNGGVLKKPDIDFQIVKIHSF